MQTIPDYVKINGKQVRVNQSSRGHGYVAVGESSAEMTDEQYAAAMAVVDDYNKHCEAWQSGMYYAFTQALKKERMRLKKNK